MKSTDKDKEFITILTRNIQIMKKAYPNEDLIIFGKPRIVDKIFKLLKFYKTIGSPVIHYSDVNIYVIKKYKMPKTLAYEIHPFISTVSKGMF